MTCPSFEHLLQAFEQRDASDPARLHAARCPACSERWQALDASLRGLSAGPFPAVPAAVRQRAVAAVEGLATTGDAGPGPLQRLRLFVAQLIEDTLAEPAAAFRKAGDGSAGEGRQLAFRAGRYELDLYYTAERALIGQLVGAGGGDELELYVASLEGPGGGRLAALEASGDFGFEQVPPARYSLFIEGGDDLVAVQLDLAGPEARGEA